MRTIVSAVVGFIALEGPVPGPATIVHALTKTPRRGGMPRREWAAIAPCIAILMVLAGCGQSAPAQDKKDNGDGQAGVILTPTQIRDLGITTALARAATYRQAVSGYGVVVALDMIAQADADIETAAATAAQSAAAAARARSLSTGPEAAVSREVAEAAQGKATADAAALGLARRKLQSLFGLHAPWRTPAQRKAILAKLSRGQAVLVRVTFPLGALNGLRPDAVSLARLGNAGRSWTSRAIWEAPADPNLPGNGYYCLLEGSDLAQNEHLAATVRVGPQASGIWIPQAAILVGENGTWAYAEPSPGHFVRVPIDTGKPDNGGLFLAGDAGIVPNERIVTGAAGLLMARETNPAAGAGD